MSKLIGELGEIDTFALDLDGVLYTGEKPVYGSKETVEALLSEGKKVRYITNFPYSRKTIHEKLRRVVGIDPPEEHISTVAQATGLYIKDEGGGTAYVMGFDDLKSELRTHGIKILDKSEMTQDGATKTVPDWVIISLCEDDFYKEASIVGRILELDEFPESRYLATSKGRGWTREHGVTPGIGCTIALLDKFSGKKPIIIGKPAKIFTDKAFANWDIDATRTALVGDKWSDMETANTYSIIGIKVETGKQDFFESIEKVDEKSEPRIVCKSIGGIFNREEIRYSENHD